MIAKYAGKCKCGASFKRGAEIEYSRATRQVIACQASGCGPTDRGRLECGMLDPNNSFDQRYEDDCARQCGL